MRHAIVVKRLMFLTCCRHGLSLMVGIAIATAGLTTSAAERPNVLMIVVDDLNDWVEPLGGHPQVKTPAIKELAKQGVTFTNAHCQAPLCNPSRTSFLLSKRPSTTGIYALNSWFRDVPRLKNQTTLLQHFSNHGYETYCVGKVFHATKLARERPGPQPEVDHLGPGQHPNPMPEQKISGTHPIDGPIVDWGVFGDDMRERCDWQSADWTIEKLNVHDFDKPFFMACGFYLPHVPIYTTQVWHDMYPLETLQLPPILAGDRDDCSPFARYLTWRDPYPLTDWLEANDQLKPLVRAYLAATSFMDSQVARVLKALDQTGQRENTVVVLFSDHGFHCGEKGASGKHYLWNESTQVPLFISAPGLPLGARCGQPVELLDLYPTLAELCGLPIPADIEGQSLMPQLRDPREPRLQPAICTSSPNNHSVCDQRWRLIEYADGSRELYDRVEDPHEFRNLIHDPQYVSQVNRLATWLPKINARPVPGSKSKMLSQRAGHWYYEGDLIED